MIVNKLLELSYLKKVLFMAFLFSGLLNSTWTTCSSGEERTSVSYAGSPPLPSTLVDMADTLNEEGGTVLVHLEIIPSQRKKK